MESNAQLSKAKTEMMPSTESPELAHTVSKSDNKDRFVRMGEPESAMSAITVVLALLVSPEGMSIRKCKFISQGLEATFQNMRM